MTQETSRTAPAAGPQNLSALDRSGEDPRRLAAVPLRRAQPRHGLFLFAGLLALLSLASCRTAQQEARRNGNIHNQLAHGTAVLGQEVDSLMMVQGKLIEVLDSMTDLVEADHDRIRALEREVEELRQRAQASVAQASAAQAPTARAHAPAPRDNRVPIPPPVASQGAAPSAAGATTAPAAAEPTASASQNGHLTGPGTSASTPEAQQDLSVSTLQDRYAAALRLFNDRSYASALTAFRALEQDDPRGTYASNYKYWQGECWYALQNYEQALQAFGTVMSEYPHTTKSAAAQYKIGQTYERLENATAARDAYERVLANYGTSEYASRARTRLTALGR